MATMQDLLERNKAVNLEPLPYLSEMMASGGPPPGTLIVACVDPQCVPEAFLNTHPGEVAVHRNAGGNIRHALQEINISESSESQFKLKEIAIIHRTNCGTLHFTNEKIRAEVKKYVDESHWSNIDKMEFGPNTESSNEQSVKDHLKWIQAHPLVRKELKKGTQGFVFDIKTGKVENVDTA